MIGGLGAPGAIAVIQAIEIPLLLRLMAGRQRRVCHVVLEGTQGTLLRAEVAGGEITATGERFSRWPDR